MDEARMTNILLSNSRTFFLESQWRHLPPIIGDNMYNGI